MPRKIWLNLTVNTEIHKERNPKSKIIRVTNVSVQPNPSYVSTRVALSNKDAALYEKLPMKERLHVTEIVEAGRGSVRLANGAFTMTVRAAGLTHPRGTDLAEIRMDVMADFIKAVGRGG